MSNGAIVLTGATGVVGMEVLARLLERGEDDVVVLLRAADQEAADRRLADTLARLWDDPPRDARVRAVPGDVTADGLGLDAGTRRELCATADRIVHCAAAVGFDQPLNEALAINALGTQRVLELANDLERLRRVVHVSTAFVSGRFEGRFGEDDLSCGQAFRNTYEQSKHLAERLVAASGLPVVVARPSIVVGDGTSGWTPAFSALYLPLRAFARGLLDRVPADPRGIVDAVPLDYVAGAIVHLLGEPGIDGQTFHLVAGDRAARVSDVLRLAQQRFAQPEPVYAPLQRAAGTEALVPYFDVRTQFDDARARRLLEPAGLSAAPLDALFERLMDYAEATRWGRRPTTREAARRAAAGAAPLEVAA
ncbi:MAG: SDR family oxidoreductase [Solirubrobacteraceae bacterium]|nr:SDR family oxidoreductase [Solirubrobacteraceae bacterium]